MVCCFGPFPLSPLLPHTLYWDINTSHPLFSFFFFFVFQQFLFLFVPPGSFLCTVANTQWSFKKRTQNIKGLIYKSCSDEQWYQWYPRSWTRSQCWSGVLQLQQVRDGRKWITSCVGAGQQEVPRSNVKCMYCNKHVQLKRALVILLER